MTLLVSKLAAQPAPPKAETLLAAARARSPRGAFAELPILGRVWIELPGDTVEAEIEGAVFAAMDALRLPPITINAQSYGSRRMALTLAWAVRNPDKTDEHFGTAEQWCDVVDADLRAACGLIYNDIRARLSPLQVGELTAGEIDQIVLGIEKKNPTPLLSSGVVALTAFLLSGAVRLASSPTTPSSSGESSSES